MTQQPSSPAPTIRNRLGAALGFAALALLVGCGAPVAAPGIQVDLATTSVDVVRGASVQVQVDVTRLGAATDSVDLTIAELPDHVTAAFSPATLDGGALTSTLTIDVAAAAVDAVTDLTVSATSGALTDDVSLSLAITSLTVVGRVEAHLDRPFATVQVASQGATDLTDASGAFTLTGLSIPYDLVVSTFLGDGAVHVYEGLTATSLLVRPAFVDAAGTPFDRAANLSGTVLGGAAIGANEAVVVCVEGITIPVYGCDRVASATTDYGFTADWFEDATAAVRLHALHVEVDAVGIPVAYLGYDTVGVNLQDGVPTAADLTFAPIASTPLTGTSSFPIGTVDRVLVAVLRFGPRLSMTLAFDQSPPTDFEVLVPEIPGVAYDLIVGAGSPAGEAYLWRRDVGTDAGMLTVDEPIDGVTPTAGAVDVGLGTPFVTTAGAGVRTFVWTPTGAGPLFALTTSRSEVTIPEPALGGFVLPVGASYGWRVFGHGSDGIDEATSGGYADLFRLQIVANLVGGPGLEDDGTGSMGASRGFTFAP